MCGREEGICGRGHAWQGGCGKRGMRAGETATETGGTHPTEMNSYFYEI